MRVIYIPAGRPPHKTRRVTDASHRLAMLRLALAGHENAEIDTIELDRAGPSFTVDTLATLRDRFGPTQPLRLLIGADMAAIFYQWREPERIIKLAEPVVMMREPYDADDVLATLPEEVRAAWSPRLLNLPTIDVASTELRRRLEAEEYDAPVVTRMLDPRVIGYIRANHLYRASHNRD